MRDDRGKPFRMLGSHVDIPERKQAELALQEKSFLLSESQRIAKIGSWSFTPATGEVLWTDETFRLYGVPKETGAPPLESFLSLIHEDDRAAMREWIRASLAGESPCDLEFRVPLTDGGIRVLNGRGDLERDAEKRPVRMFGTVQDITERKRAEELLQESERKYRELVENANSIILRWGRDGRITFINEFGQKFFGYSEEEIHGRHVSGTIVPETESTGRDLSSLMEQICASPELFEQNINENVLRNGERVWISWTNKPVFDKQGNLLEVFSVGSDITKHKQVEQELEKHREHLEELINERTVDLQDSKVALVNLLEDLNAKTAELERANERLKEMDRLKSLFIASMSHELRTPLNSVIGFSCILLNEWAGPINNEQRENLGSVLRSGKHLLNLINDVIDVSKIEAGKLDVHIEDFDACEVISEVAKSVSKDAADKNLSFVVECASVRMQSDRRHLMQCVLNLLTNAIKYTEKGSVRLVTRKRTACPIPRQGELRHGSIPPEVTEALEVIVEDTGIGIRQEDMEKLFISFSRLDSPLRSKVPGTGLGLYLTRNIVMEVLKGELSAESTYGSGSRFALRVPVRLAENV